MSEPTRRVPRVEPSAGQRASRPRRVAALALLLAAACSGGTAGAPARLRAAEDRPVSFALIGDMPYSGALEQEFERVMDALDTADVDFVVHVGDIHGGSQPCTDSLQRARRDRFDRSAHPFVLLFGDNEWTDCHRTGFDPEERQRALRRLFASGP